MKIAVSSQGTTLDAQMDERFGRAAYILIVDTDTLAVEALDNSANIRAAQGAGIQAASMVSGRGAKALLTGFCGPKAMNAFQAVHIDVYTGQSGMVREAVERFRKGGLKPVNTANVAEKYGISGMPGVGRSPNRSATMSYGGGMGGGRGRGIGCGGRGIAGGGRGMGGGGGMGMAGGVGFGMGNPLNPGSMPRPRAETLEELKQQAEALKAQLDAIERKIESF